jgi:hypothetical protein
VYSQARYPLLVVEEEIMKRIGQAINFAALLGVGSLLLFAQTSKAADDPYGLSAYKWMVSWSTHSTWCFYLKDGALEGDEIGAGRAHADTVTYDTTTFELAWHATSANGLYIADYRWTMVPDDKNPNHPKAQKENGTISFSKKGNDPLAKPVVESISITRGDPRDFQKSCEDDVNSKK